MLNTIPNDFLREQATFHVTADAIKIREAPTIAGKNTGVVYEKGQSLNYDGYIVREGYVWISWIGGTTDTRCWMACGTKYSAGQVNHWRTFS